MCERARHLSQKCRLAKLQRQNAIDKWDESCELLETLLSIRAILPRIPPALIDVGAHLGAFARGADQVLGFEQILCVEPDEELLPRLLERVPAGKTIVKQVALSDSSGVAEFHVHADRSMNSLLPADRSRLGSQFPTYSHDATKTRAITTTTLDALLADHESFNGRELLIKLDTQGTELQVLRGGTKALEHTSACLIEFMFCTPYVTSVTFHDLVSFMQLHGFGCDGALNIMRRPTHQISAVDFLFTRNGIAPS